MEKEKKEQIALSVGFLAIIIVFIFTLFHADSFTSKNETTNVKKTIPESAAANFDYATISPQDLQKNILQKNRLTLLDVRSFDSYIQEHIIDSSNMPLDEFPANGKFNNKDLTIVIGQNNADPNIKKAADELKKEGFQNTQVLAGGMDSWKSMIGLTVTYGNPKSFVDQTKVSYIEAEQLQDAIKEQAQIFIVDVRTPSDFAKGHIEGAVNIPFDQLEKRRTEADKPKAVIIGLNELQEFQAAVQLYDMLKLQPYVVRGAINGWQEKGFPVVQ